MAETNRNEERGFEDRHWAILHGFDNAARGLKSTRESMKFV